MKALLLLVLSVLASIGAQAATKTVLFNCSKLDGGEIQRAVLVQYGGKANATYAVALTDRNRNSGWVSVVPALDADQLAAYLNADAGLSLRIHRVSPRVGNPEFIVLSAQFRDQNNKRLKGSFDRALMTCNP